MLRLRHMGLVCSFFLILGASTAMAQVDCTGVPQWALPTIYDIGDRVVFEGRLYECIVPSQIVTPPSDPVRWRDLGACGGGGGGSQGVRIVGRAIELTITSADGVAGSKSATGATETPSVTHSAPVRQSLIGLSFAAPRGAATFLLHSRTIRLPSPARQWARHTTPRSPEMRQTRITYRVCRSELHSSETDRSVSELQRAYDLERLP